LGDGVLVYLGYPQAHEDDAEGALRADLELVAAVGALKTRAPLQTRVGIATGLVVVGDLIGSGASQEQAVERCPHCGGQALRCPGRSGER
jgi:class 3 adenylate cyclase